MTHDVFFFHIGLLSSFCSSLSHSTVPIVMMFFGNIYLGSGFKDFFIFTPMWGRFPF